MVKKTYVPNRTGIPTHRVNLGHRRHRMEERTQEMSMEPPQGEERRKKERDEKERERRVSDPFCAAVMPYPHEGVAESMRQEN
jgi:hypothetical protein